MVRHTISLTFASAENGVVRVQTATPSVASRPLVSLLSSLACPASEQGHPTAPASESLVLLPFIFGNQTIFTGGPCCRVSGEVQVDGSLTCSIKHAAASPSALQNASSPNKVFIFSLDEHGWTPEKVRVMKMKTMFLNSKKKKNQSGQDWTH